MNIKYTRVMPMFPFDEISPGAEIVIYGVGDLGKEYIKQIISTKYAKVKYAVDQKWKQILDFPVRVLSPDTLFDEKNAVIVIAIESDDIYHDVKRKLIDMGITSERVVHSIEFQSVQIPHEEMMEENYYTFIKSVKATLNIKNVLGKALTRIGKNDDGGYVMLNDFSAGRCAYSYGINNDVSWDNDIAERGYNIYMYDHTIDSLPYDRDEFHFYKQGIAGKVEGVHRFTTLEQCIKNNGHINSRNMILKMDVEGCEWEVLENVKQEIISKFSQIVIEFHSVFDYHRAEEILSVLHKMNKTHQVIHVHGNNYSKILWCDGIPYPDALEVTYVSKEQHEFEDNNDVLLPISLDKPNCPYVQETPLGYWNHV